MIKFFKGHFFYYVCLFLIFLFFVIGFFSYSRLSRNVIDSSLSYVSSDNSSYDVFYSGLVSGKTNNSSFIRKYVDNINFNFDYLLNFTSGVSGKMDVLVKASVVVLAPNSDSVIWMSDSDFLYRDSYSYSNTGLFRFNNGVSIDYKKYFDIYSDFKNDSSIISDSYILVEFISSSSFKPFNTDSLSINDSISYKIPLTDVTFSISKVSNVSSDVVNTYKDFNVSFYRFLLRFSYFIVFSSLVSMFFKYYFNNSKKDKFTLRLNRILRSYNSIIVNVLNFPQLDKKFFVVSSFGELLNVQMELRCPINFIRYKNKAKFFIVSNDVCWIFILRRDNVYEKEL